MSRLSQWVEENSAAVAAGAPATVAGPKGLAGPAQSRLSQWVGETSATGAQAQSPLLGEDYRQWYTGRNLEGTDNGWSTPFQEKFIAGFDRAQEEGDVFGYFEREDAVGVVTWDGAKDSEGTSLKFGDVVVDGVKVADVYEDFDEHTANVLMATWLPEVDRTSALRRNDTESIRAAFADEVARARQVRTEQAEVAPRARALDEAAKEGAEDESVAAITLAGAGGGAATGAGIGAALTAWLGPGAAVGAGIGATVGGFLGGLGAFLNSDGLAYQAARSREIVEIAAKDGADATLAVALGEVAQNFNSMALNPLGNLVKGGYDVYRGVSGGGPVFDPSSGGAYQEVDEEGRRRAGGLAQGLEHAAMLVDSALMFASPLARAAYTTQMTMQIGSGVAQLVPGIGQYDQERVEMNSVWTRREVDPETGRVEERFDLGNSLAGIGSVAIDAVQLGGMRGLLRQSEQLSTQVAAATGMTTWTARFSPSKGLKRLGFDKRDELLMTTAQREALRAGGSQEVRAGYRFVFDEAGDLVGSARPTLSLLAPSEALQSISAKAMARREVAKGQGAVEAEALYRAASDLALGSKPMQSILVNAFGEGIEELAQATLDPVSQDHAIDAEQVLRSAAAGFASGAGMGIANVIQEPSQDQRMFQMARTAHFFRTDGTETLTEEEWQAMDPLQKRVLARSMHDLTRSTLQAGFEKLQDERTAAVNAGVIGAQWYEDFRKEQVAASLDTSLTSTDVSLRIVRLDEASKRPDAVVTSGARLLADQRRRSEGIAEQRRNLMSELDAARARTSDPADPDVVRLTGLVDQLKRMAFFSDQIERHVEYALAEIESEYDAGNMALADARVDQLNGWLQSVYDMQEADLETVTREGVRTFTLSDEQRYILAAAVSRVTTRHPQDSTGSYHSFVPQLSRYWTQRRTHGQAGISQLVLKSLRGDYDGDRVQVLQQLVLDRQEYIALRSGANKLGAAMAPVVDTTKSEKWIVGELANAIDHEQDTIRQLALAVKTGISHDLRRLYDDPGDPQTGRLERRLIPSHVLDEVERLVFAEVDRGGDVRGVLLEEMQRRAPEELARIGRGGMPGLPGPVLSDQVLILGRLATTHLQEFQKAYAAMARPTGTPSPVSVEASRHTSDAQEERAISAATVSATMFNTLRGTSLFRMFQTLNHSAFSSTSLYSGWASKAPDAYRLLVEDYKALTSNVTRSELERVQAGDEITATVLAQLRRMALDPRALENIAPGLTQPAHMALLANLRVPQFTLQPNESGALEPKYTGDTVTLLQQLLYLSLQEYRRQNRQVFETNEDVQAAYNNAMRFTHPNKQGRDGQRPGNAEAAFVHVFSAVKLYELVGSEAMTLGAQLTVGQLHRRQVSLHPSLRADGKHSLRTTQGAYLDSEDVEIPYDIDTVSAGRVTGYRVVVDAVFSAADSEISMYMSGAKKGQLIGRKAHQNTTAKETFYAAHTAVRKLLQALDKSNAWTAERIAAYAGVDATFGKALLNAIPANTRDLVLKGTNKDGTPEFARWFYEVFATETAEAAEAVYLRNYWLQSWYSKVRSLDLENEGIDEKSGKLKRRIQYRQLDSRMHRLMYQLASQGVGESTRFELFVNKLARMEKVEDFITWANTTPGIGDMESVPLLEWVDDTAEFDADKSDSGWTKRMSMPAVQESLRALRSVSERIVKDLSDDRSADTADGHIARQIELVHKVRTGLLPADTSVPPEAENYYEQLLAVIRVARQRRVANGPRAMIQDVSIAAHGMYDKAHNKGITSQHLAAVQMRDVVDGAFGFLVNFEKLFGDLTSHTEAAVAQSPDVVMQDGGSLMTRHGQMSDWAEMGVGELLPYLLDDKKRHLARSFLAAQVIDLDGDSVARRKLLLGRGLEDLLNSTSQKDLFNDEGGAPRLMNAMKYLAVIEGHATAAGKPYAVQNKVREIVLSWTTAATHRLSFVEIQDLTVQAHIALAETLMDASRTRIEDGVDPANEAFLDIQLALSRTLAADLLGIDDAKRFEDLEKMRDAAFFMIYDSYVPTIRGWLEAADTALQAGDIAAADRYRGYAEGEERLAQAEIARMRGVLTFDIVEQRVAQYGYRVEDADGNPVSEAEKHRIQDNLIRYVQRNPLVIQGAGEALPAVIRINEYIDELAVNPATTRRLVMDDKMWSTLGNTVISIDIWQLTTSGAAWNPPPPISDDPYKRRFHDPSFSYLVDFLRGDGGSELLDAARSVAINSGKTSREINSDQLAQTVLRTIYSRVGRWTEVVPAMNIEGYDQINGASSVPAVSQAGKLSERWGTVIAAGRRKIDLDPDPATDSTVQLTWQNLAWDDAGGAGNRYHDVTVRHPNGRTYTRPFQQIHKRFARSAQLSFTAYPSGSRLMPPDPAADLMQNTRATQVWAGAINNPELLAGQDLREVDLERMRDEIRRMVVAAAGPGASAADIERSLATVRVDLEIVHPDTQPVETYLTNPDTVKKGESHYGSVWYDGLVFSSGGDVSYSALAMLFFGDGGVNPVFQQAALDTRKDGRKGIEGYDRPLHERVLAIEAMGQDDFAGMLLAKTRLIMETTIVGGKTIDPSYFNAVYKLVRMSHWLDGVDSSGTRVRLTSEQVIAWQLANPGQGYPVTEAALWKPTYEVMSSMMGDPGFGGVQGRLLHTEPWADLERIDRFEGWSPMMEERFPIAVTSRRVDMASTDVGKVSRMSDVGVRYELDPGERSRFEKRQVAMRTARDAALQERARATEAGDFDPKQTLRKARKYAEKAVDREDVTLRLSKMWAWASAGRSATVQGTRDIIREYVDSQRSETGNLVAGWVYEHQSAPSTQSGVLTWDSLNAAMRKMVAGDFVVINTAQFRDLPAHRQREIDEVLEKFAAANVAVMFVSKDGRDSRIAELTHKMLRRHRFNRYQDNPRILVPDVMQSGQTLNVAASESNLTAHRALRVADQRLTLLTLSEEVEENTMWVPVRRDRKHGFHFVQVIRDMLPLDVASRFGDPVEQGQREALRDRVHGLDNAEGRELLLRFATAHLRKEMRDPVTGEIVPSPEFRGEDAAAVQRNKDRYDEIAAEFDVSWKRLIENIDRRVERGTVLPLPGEDFGTGDFIPLLGPNSELLLYRHGHRFPDDFFDWQLDQAATGSDKPRGVAMYGSDPIPNATTRRGKVSRVIEHREFGFQIEFNVPVEEMGAKIQVEHNGMKYLLTDLPPGTSLPDAPLLGDAETGRYLDGVASLHDAISKEALAGLVDSFQAAFAVIGIDFMPYLTRFFGSRDAALQVLRAVERAPDKLSVDEAYEMMTLDAGVNAQMNLLVDALPAFDQSMLLSTWTDRLFDDTDVDAGIARAMLSYLMTSGSNLDAVLRSSGVWIDQASAPGAVTQVMPALFTQFFDMQPKGSPLRAELMDVLNKRIGSGPPVTAGPRAGEDSGWYLDDNWMLNGLAADGRVIRGMLQFGEAHVSDDNPYLDSLAFERRQRQSASIHQQWLTYNATGGQTFVDPGELAKLSLRLSEKQVTTGISPEDRPGRLWRDLTFVEKTTNGPASRWQKMTPMEYHYANLMLALRYPAYRKPIDMSGNEFDELRDRIEEVRREILLKLHLRPSQGVLVDYWIRQMLFRPAQIKGQDAYEDNIRPEDIFGAIRDIHANILDGMFPTQGGRGPNQIPETDLALLQAANAGRSDGWAPRRFGGDRREPVDADDYGQWVTAAFGHAFSSTVEIDPIVVMDMDAMLNTYRPMLAQMGKTLNVTLNHELQTRFLEPRTNQLITVTTSPMKRRQLMEQVILPATELSLEDLQWGVGTAENLEGRDGLNHWSSRVNKRVSRYRAKNKVRPLERQSAPDFLENGERVLDNSGNMHSLQRIVIALRHGTTMLIPGLYLSMLPEQAYRGYISQVAAALEGNLMSPGLGRVAASVQNQAGRTLPGQILQRAGITVLDTDQIAALQRLYDNLGSEGSFKAILLRDMMFTQYVEGGPAGRVVNFFENFAKVGNYWQDPTRGTPQKAMARRYVEALWRSIQAAPLSTTMTFDSMVAALTLDPAYFQKTHPELHRMAVNAVSDFRSLKQTPMSLAARWMYEGLSNHNNMALRFAGTLLKLPLMYANYNMNVLTTITGTQGFVAALGMSLDKRRTPGHFMNRLAKKARGEELTPEDDIRYDMSSTIEAYNLANSFIRGGVTQTGLFLLGMTAAGGLGLGGEDEEERRRRRLAEAQNSIYILDPRELQNDFRNKDMFFLDWLPSQLSFVKGFFDLGDGRSGFQMSWVLKQFLSPVLGMERFFQTGDFGYVTAGFRDAIGSLPLFNRGSWDDAVRTAEELQNMALEQQEIGTPTAMQNTMWLLTNVVGVYERMLLENMFLNAIYTGFDPWDRDPSKRPLLDSDGEIQRMLDNTPRQNDLSLQTIVGEDGKVRDAYQPRDFWDKQFAMISENNLVAMLGLSLFTGFQNGYNRYSQPVKLHTIDIPELTKNEAQRVVGTLLDTAWREEGGLPRELSLAEVTSLLKDQFIKAGDWDSYNNLDAIAERVYESEANPEFSALSALDLEGNEVPTSEGVRALLRGLHKGTITLDDPEIRKYGISPEVREEIQEEWFADTIQQGIDLGLTRTVAERRAKRLFSGPLDDPTISGFGDFLWSDKIPTDAELKYKQLNTTYVIGPDGFPWATGFKRGGFWQSLGLPKRPNIQVDDTTGADNRLNTTDLGSGINTGLRGLVPLHPSELIPTDVEIGKSIEETLRDLKDTSFTPFEPFSSNSDGRSSGRWYRSGGFRGYGRRGYGSRSGGGSGGYSPTIYWTRQPTLPRGTNVYGNSIRNVFWDFTNQRDSTIRRERYTSQRGRLKQWQ